MTTIYTSYFANIKNIDTEKYMPIGIAGKSPEGWKFPEYKKLAPSWSIWSEWHDAMEFAKGAPDAAILEDEACKEYTKRFVGEILANREPETVLGDISKLADGKIPVLCCYEKPGEFCHRHIVADWLTENTIAKVREFQSSVYCNTCMHRVHDGVPQCNCDGRISEPIWSLFMELVEIYASLKYDKNWDRINAKTRNIITELCKISNLCRIRSENDFLPLTEDLFCPCYSSNAMGGV